VARGLQGSLHLALTWYRVSHLSETSAVNVRVIVCFDRRLGLNVKTLI
jgi:hypothetical protein